jgi:hypothetical protein
MFRNRRNGTFENITGKAGLLSGRQCWGTGCASLDYDRDGYLDLFVANYPPGLPDGKNILYHNRGDGTFDDVSDRTGITKAKGTYGLGVSTLDFNYDGWTDIYVANDSNPSTLYRNDRDGKFTDVAISTGCAYSQDGKLGAGMGVAVGDYDHKLWR